MKAHRRLFKVVEPRDVLEPGQATRFYVATFGGEFFAHATEWTNSIEECLEAVKQNPPPAASLPLQLMSITYHHLGSVDAYRRRPAHRRTWSKTIRRKLRPTVPRRKAVLAIGAQSIVSW